MSDENCRENCKSNQSERCVPFFDVQNTMITRTDDF